MASEFERTQKLAVLIDAENASPRIAAALFDEIATIGDASLRRIYGDFSGTRLKGWSEPMARFAILPCQNFANTAGKNASDIALVIDAMDILHSGHFDGFCLVSSDGDFTRLAARIRERGLDVFGFGEQKTPESFRRACKRFIYVENLSPHLVNSTVLATEAVTGEIPDVPPKQPPSAAVELIRTTLDQLEDTAGWYFLGAVGSRLANLSPDFDPRSYGCPKLLTLIEKSQAFEVNRDNLKVYIRPKSSQTVRTKN